MQFTIIIILVSFHQHYIVPNVNQVLNLFCAVHTTVWFIIIDKCYGIVLQREDNVLVAVVTEEYHEVSDVRAEVVLQIIDLLHLPFWTRERESYQFLIILEQE